MDEVLQAILESQKSTVRVGGKEVTLDAKNLFFNEATLNEYMVREGALYNYYGQVLADAQAEWQMAKLDAEIVYSEKYKQFKQGATEKQAEAHAKTDPDVIKANKRVIARARTVELVKNHLKAWDKNHDNAQSLGHMIRKEMDKLGMEIKYQRDEMTRLFEDSDKDQG